ncbi:MAG: nucleoside-diphosphate sugar epimerase/dehydratase [Pseudomonadota bacterium]
MVATDALLLPISLLIAMVLSAGQWSAAGTLSPAAYPILLAIGIPGFALFRLYRAVVRFFGIRTVKMLVLAIGCITLVFGMVEHIALGSALTVPTLVIFAMVATLSIGGSRMVARVLLERQVRSGERVMIYGAGGAGARLASALVGGQEFVPTCFLDDNDSLHGSMINGLTVYSPGKLNELIESLDTHRVLLALPSISRRRRQRILTRLESLPVHVQTMPNFSDLIAGNARVDDIRDVDVADLLGRDAVPPNEALLDACIVNKVVMVTGAGGSIGSELCRQIIRQRPRHLVLVESSELALYSINRELNKIIQREAVDVRTSALLGSVRDKSRVRDIMETFGVQTVYHAAAYKHVPVVEENIIEGIDNNVFGTLHTAEAAIEAGVETFVLISTDKAVGPTNVMGAAKRLAEIVLQGLHERGSSTRFCMVRFGNVLASSGSVVPLFRDQIRSGGPVTVTHPEIIRYFMTIPEAALLVIQAGSMGQGGDVFLLDMGKPVRIDDLARRMIHLMGLTVLSKDNPEGDIEIKYTGLRPAEKLYEELLIGTNAMGTEHPMIMRAEEKSKPWAEVRSLLARLRDAVDHLDAGEARRVLMASVDEYRPAAAISDLVWVNRRANTATSAGLNPVVTPLNPNS